MKHFFSFLLFNFIFLTASYSCDCWGPEFCGVIGEEENLWLNQGYQVQAVKIRDVQHGMEMQVIENYGTALDSDLIMVWGDLGWLCREYTSNFLEGDTLILNLIKIGEHSVTPQEDPEDFQLSFCGRHYLNVKEGIVRGYINEQFELDSIPLENFEKEVIKRCQGKRSSIGPLSSELDLLVYPNPVSDFCQIVSDEEIAEIILYDAAGRKVTELSQKNTKSYQLDMQVCASGLYLAQVKSNNGNEKIFRIIKLE